MNGRDPRRRGDLGEYLVGGVVTFLIEVAVVVALALVAVLISLFVLAVT